MRSGHGLFWSKGSLSVLLVVALDASAGAASEDPQASMFSLHGFGTLGEVSSDAHQADFTGNFFQPDGTGYTRSWALGVDSKLGLQADAHLTDKLSAVVQVVSQYEYDGAWTPRMEWANLNYQFTPDFDLRIGRTIAATFMLSDTRLVGYTYPWIRPPQEVYGNLPITNLDGVGVGYRGHSGAVTNTLRLTYGQTSVKIVGGGEGKAKSIIEFNDTVESGSFTFRAAYTTFLATLHSPGFDALFGGFTQFGEQATSFGFAAAGAQALALGEKYRLVGFRYSGATVGASYDPGPWLLMAEVSRIVAAAAISDETAWYITGGYRYRKLTPFISLAQVHSHKLMEPGITLVGLPPPLAVAAELNSGLTAVINGFGSGQKSASLGVRWDCAKNTDLKVQYDLLKLDSDGHGLLGNVQPGFQIGGTVNVFSVAVDVVF